MSESSRKSKVWPVVRVASGNFLEMYDFMVFGYYAATIGRTFFPGGSEYASLMKSLMTFAAGYLMRPLGAIVLGAYIDRHGRRKGLLLTLTMMAVGTLSVACMPGYVTIGLIAPSLILLGRLVQGLSAGAQLGGVSVYLAEIATPGRKGFYVSWQSASQQVAVMLAAVIGVILSFTLTPADMDRWGWRIPLLVGCAIIPFLFVLRSSLEETEEFAARTHHPSFGQVLQSLGSNWKLVTLGMMLATLTTVAFYLITVYTPTFGGITLHLQNTGVQVVLLCVGASNFFWLPVMGALADRVGRITVLVTFSLVTLITAYPTMLWLVDAPSFTRLLVAELWISFLYGGYNGAMVVYLVEIMPASVRTAGFSVAYALATAIFGGFTPAICTWLIQVTGNKAVPGLWLSLAAAMALTSALVLARSPLPAGVPKADAVALQPAE